MKYAPPALLALLLFLSLPASALVATGPSNVDPNVADLAAIDDHPSPGLVEVEETANRLALEDDGRSGYVSTGPDLGASLVAADDELRVDHDRFGLDRTLDGANVSEREAAIEEAHDRVTRQINALEERERNAVREHANGERTDEELRAVLIRNYREAGELRETLGELEDHADDVPDYSISNAARSDRGKLEIFRTPVRARLATVTDGTQGGESIDSTLETTETGFVLATIDGGTYVREAVRFDNRDTTQPSRFDSNTKAFEYVAEELYPWAFDVSTTSGSSQYTGHRLYRAHATHDHGDLEVFLDAGTGDVYREVQQLRVAELPPASESQSSTNGSLELTVNRTPLNGPVEATVTDLETGDPVDATIDVDGDELGETGDDGSLWLLPPADEYELTANAADGNVTAAISGG